MVKVGELGGKKGGKPWTLTLAVEGPPTFVHAKCDVIKRRCYAHQSLKHGVTQCSIFTKSQW